MKKTFFGTVFAVAALVMAAGFMFIQVFEANEAEHAVTAPGEEEAMYSNSAETNELSALSPAAGSDVYGPPAPENYSNLPEMNEIEGELFNF